MPDDDDDGSMQGPPPDKDYRVEFDAPDGYSPGPSGETRTVKCKIHHKGDGKCCLIEMDGVSVDEQEDRVATANKLGRDQDYEIPRTLREAGKMHRKQKGWMS